MSQDRRGIPRREFVKSAVAIGGASALAACLDRSPEPIPTGTTDLSTLPERQHAWNDVLDIDDAGNPLNARHHLLLLLDYTGDGTPSDGDRETVESALRSLERAYERSNEGLLFTLGYSRAYFDRYDAAPAGVDLPRPEALAPFENPDPDTPDAILHLASDRGDALLGAEEALRGNQSTANGVETTSWEDVFTVADRRTGFVGSGLPAEHDDVSGVPDGAVDEDAPLYMGFKSGFRGSQASEDRVTIQSGPFAGGATEHASYIELNLDQWYEQDSRYQRVAKMFCPAHAENDRVEGVGENLGASNGVASCEKPEKTAREDGVVGHSQKMAGVREDGSPLIIRRDFDSTDGGRAGLHFVSLQREIGDFVETREAMNGTDVTEESAVGQRNNNGILQYMNVVSRGNYLLPPRSRRALPEAEP
ncbi:Tat pathway signal protein [Salarchaeum sp. JOR-1]|uniref:DUF7405 family protein n=1 Tax=Salarchaeum sp. JOR-1 TaxID=2599399 RepID=UPI001198C1DE|nr:Tat pathway signal protein [Salarchaeum sp. JOR-1]QDX39586.1 Tat pathway signal protein [Salarchaeum sp. JOR-1]